GPENGEDGGIRAEQAWDTLIDDSGVVIAVIDSGILEHADITRVLSGYDFISADGPGVFFTANDGNGRDADPTDPGDATSMGECGDGAPEDDQDSSWHGTLVTGLLVAQTNNAAGIAGIADQAFVLPLRALGRCGGYLSDIADAIRWAAGLSVSGIPANLNPADVINLSLGSTGSCTQTEQSAINAAVNAGVVVIAAAGNEGATKISAPANCSNVIAVAATTRDGAETCYTNIGRNVDISAPGGNSDQPSLGCTTTAADGIRLAGNDGTTTAGDDDYYSEIGTSFSTPMVAGAAALMKAVDDTLTPASIDAILKNTARIFPAAASDGFDDCNIARCGTGILDIQAAIAIAADPVTNDSIPDAFSLGNKTDVTPEDTVISNTIRISGINVPTPVIIHNGEYSIDSNPFTEEAGTISNDQTIRVRLTAAADFSETVKSVLMVGGHRSTFSVTTASMFSNDGGGGGGVSGGLSVLCAGMLLYRRRMDQALKIK
ncbi:MAG TPA: S8 family peptidase, partial [Gammaproteobacteria bacterium]